MHTDHPLQPLVDKLQQHQQLCRILASKNDGACGEFEKGMAYAFELTQEMVAKFDFSGACDDGANNDANYSANDAGNDADNVDV